MFKYFMLMNAFFGLVATIFSFYEKDYQNCAKQHGEEFAIKRKKLLRIVGPILFIGPCAALLIDYIF
jgi:hypothetical protein